MAGTIRELGVSVAPVNRSARDSRAHSSRHVLVSHELPHGSSIALSGGTIYRLLRPTAPSVFNRDVWRKAICDHFDTLPALIDNRVKGYIDIPSDAAVSPLWV